MNKDTQVISHSGLESLTIEVMAIRREMKPLRSADKNKTEEMKGLLANELGLGDGKYIVAGHLLACHTFTRPDLKSFKHELAKLGVSEALIQEALNSAEKTQTRLSLSEVDLGPEVIGPIGGTMLDHAPV
jgi:hypothetical protein